MSTSPLRVAVVGGGIGGAAAAAALLQRGMDVQLYEQAGTLTEVGAGVAIQPNGVRMLRRLGLGEELISRCQMGRPAVSSRRRVLCRVASASNGTMSRLSAKLLIPPFPL